MGRLSLGIRLFLLTACLLRTASAADFVSELTIRDVSLGGITIGTASSVSLAGQNELSNQLFAAYRDKFSMKELAVASLGGLYRSSFMTNVLSVSSAGYEDYRQTLVSLHAQKQLSEKLSLGIALQSLSATSITFEQSLWQISPSVGVEYQLNQSFAVGVDVNNPVKIASDEFDQLDSRAQVSAGIAYRMGELLLLAGEYEWTDSEDGNVKIGAEFSLIPEFNIRAGLNTQPFSPSLGCGYSFQNWTLDAACEQHRYLGTSFSVGLSYRFKK